MNRRSALCPRAAILTLVLLIAACSADDSSDAAQAPVDEAPVSEDASDATEAAVFPGQQWSYVDPEELGFDPDKLEELAQEAGEHESYCMIVTRHGQIAGEWYWQDTDVASNHEAWSVTKSLTGTLVGIAQAEGHLDLDDKVSDYISDWVGTPSKDVTIRDILSNISGRNWEVADYVGLTSAPDARSYALELGQDAPPGTTWIYNDGAIQTLEVVLESATGQEPADYAQEKIFEPIGADDSHMNKDASGHTYMYFGLQSTCQDLARFGYLFLRGGEWEGTQVLPEAWVDEATGQPSQELNAAYGYLWWLNRIGPVPSLFGGESIGADVAEAAERQLVPGAPDTMYWAQGLGGQTIQVDPETDTVVVRLGTGNMSAQYGSANTSRVVTEALEP